MFADQEELLITGQSLSLLVALALIFTLMLIPWRSLSAALLCMIANSSPIVLIFILMVMSGISLDMATAMIVSVAVGVADDDTIHLYYNYSFRRAQGHRVVTALLRSYSRAGRAVTATGLCRPLLSIYWYCQR